MDSLSSLKVDGVRGNIQAGNRFCALVAESQASSEIPGQAQATIPLSEAGTQPLKNYFSGSQSSTPEQIEVLLHTGTTILMLLS
jgi:hypothetical protein